MKNKVKIGIIGIGHFGRNYYKTLNELGEADVAWVCAGKESTINEALSKIKTKFSPKETTNYNDILYDKNVDAVAIVTSGSTHYKIAKKALLAGKHIIVEKPVAFNAGQVDELIKIANKRNKVFMAGHLHLFNPPIIRIKEDIKKGVFGSINYLSFIHAGNGLVRSDISAMWDYFPHAVSILLYLLDVMPIKVAAHGISYNQKNIEDAATMDLFFPNNVFATAFCSWNYPLKKMEMTIASQRIYATFDDYAKKKLKYYSKSGNKCSAITTSNSKPLTEQLKHFLYCIQNNEKPITDGHEALKVTKVLEAAQKSLKTGNTIKVS